MRRILTARCLPVRTHQAAKWSAQAYARCKNVTPPLSAGSTTKSRQHMTRSGRAQKSSILPNPYSLRRGLATRRGARRVVEETPCRLLSRAERDDLTLRRPRSGRLEGRGTSTLSVPILRDAPLGAAPHDEVIRLE